MNIHFVGCEGVSMRTLKRIMSTKGHSVTGSDAVLDGHDAKNVLGADLVVYTCAVGEDNVEVVSARRQGIKTIERAEFLGQLSHEFECVLAVAGSHGKTTVTGLLEEIFLPLNPTVHIGGSVLGHEESVIGGNRFFITEACEYKRNFLYLSPTVTVILNVELDHPDYYKGQKDYESAFLSLVKKSKTVVINGDDEPCKRIISAAKSNRYVTFGLGENNMYRAANIVPTEHGFSFDVLKNGRPILREVGIRLYGIHNVLNALAAIAAADFLGLKAQLLREGVGNFRGVKRRLEPLVALGSTRFFLDYAHHPSELKTTIETIKKMNAKRVTIVFEPHTYSRTKHLKSEFVQELSQADRICIVPIFAAREAPIEGVTSQSLVRELINKGNHAVSVSTFFEACEYIFQSRIDGEIVVLAGAGEIDKAARFLRENFG